MPLVNEKNLAELEVQLKKGFLLHQQGKIDDAKLAYQLALQIDPNNFNALQLLGLIELESGRIELSVDLLLKAININPNITNCHINIANAYVKSQRYKEATEHYQMAIQIDPKISQAYYGLGICFDNQNNWDQAIFFYTKVIDSQPDFIDAYQNRGACLEEQKKWKEAIQDYDSAIALNPAYFKAFSNRGNALKELLRFEEAIQSILKAISINPMFVEAYSNLGVLYTELNLIDKAIECYEIAISIDPNYHSARFNKSMALLVSGDLVNGFKDYEWRWESKVLKIHKRSYSKPLWLGDQILIGKTILVYCEQGLGDTIQFCRYLIKLSNLARQVIFEVDESLKEIIATLNCQVALITKGSDLPEFDYHCPLMSLPHAFNTTLQDLPLEENYLCVDSSKSHYWKNKISLNSQSPKIRVGLVWSGGFKAEGLFRSFNGKRNIPLENFAVFNNIDVAFFSFQKGEPAESELNYLQEMNWHGPQITHWVSELNNFSDTAALLDQMDLIITVDTAMAHLAGAIGKPVWLLNRFDTCWRWFLERNDSPWYPTMKIYRQEQHGNWNTVLERVYHDLIDFCQSLNA